MAQKKGHEAPASAYQQSKREWEALLARQASLDKAMGSGHQERTELPGKIAAAYARFQEQERKVAYEQSAAKCDDLLGVACQLDGGVTSEAIARFHYLVKELRTAGRIVGVSHLRVTLVVDQLLGKNRGTLPVFKTFQDAARAWMRIPLEVA